MSFVLPGRCSLKPCSFGHFSLARGATHLLETPSRGTSSGGREPDLRPDTTTQPLQPPSKQVPPRGSLGKQRMISGDQAGLDMPSHSGGTTPDQVTKHLQSSISHIHLVSRSSRQHLARCDLLFPASPQHRGPLPHPPASFSFLKK